MSLPCGSAARGFAAVLVVLSASCASPGPQSGEAAGDRLVLEASSAARLAYESGNYLQARNLYRRALTRAQAIDAGAHAADAAYNLAMAEIGLQQYDAADRLLAQAEFDAARVSADVADIRLLRAKVAYLRERLPQAIALAGDVLATGAPPHLVMQVRILRGQVFTETGDLAAARTELQSVKALVGPTSNALTPGVEADLDKLEGTLARLEGKPLVAARFFDAEAELLRVAHRHRDMAYALARAGEAHQLAGSPALAAERYFLAARSLAGQGDLGAGKAFVMASRSAAEAAGDTAGRNRAQSLLEDISRRGAP